MTKCLMIQTKDRRKFFTHERNYLQLIEFSKTFNAEISLVKINDTTPIMELDKLAPAICNTNYRPAEGVDYEIVENKLTKERRGSRGKILKKAQRISIYIKQKLMAGEAVSLKELKRKFVQYDLTPACLCNHMRRALAELKKQGYKYYKVAAGKYVLNI